MSDLREMHCNPKVTGTSLINQEDFLDYMNQIESEWHLNEQENSLQRQVRFNNYYESMAFVNAVAWLANMEDHHPEMLVSYNKVQITYTTHSASGLTENDFICAAKIDALLE